MATKFYFFSGKGGVGKTTTSSATALNLAGQGKKTLIVTTDPASNLADVFGQKIGHDITPIQSVDNLFAMELDPDIATNEYKEKTLGPLRDILPTESLAVIEEQLNSPCTAEMASFDKFTDFLQEGTFDEVIFDTAPTGHTLRLLELPVEWSGVIETASKDGSSGQTCIGPAAALAESKEKFDRAIEAMRDKNTTSFTFVLRPESTSIQETERSIKELQRLGIESIELIVNGVFPAEAVDNPLAMKRRQKQEEFLRIITKIFKADPKILYLRSSEIGGLTKLKEIGEDLHIRAQRLSDYTFSSGKAKTLKTISSYPKTDPSIVKLLTPDPDYRTRTIFFAGKGGVGKTSVSSATGLWLAEKGYKTLVLTTDPASHLKEVFGQEIHHHPTPHKDAPNLDLAHIDAEKATEEYKDKILSQARKKYDAERLSAIEEELDSPCTEEMATFEKFMDYMSQSEYDIIVFDTAPTGHTLRLLNLPIAWDKQLEIKTLNQEQVTEVDKATKERYDKVIDKLRDPRKTTFSFVMYPETTPIIEAHRAVQELESAGITTTLVVANLVINDSYATNNFWKERRSMQQKHLDDMKNKFSGTIATLDMMPDDLNGIDNLREAGYLLYGKE
ncbi:MAG: TRC40/GET3/ArsA family transport-energizing ATPase [Candidatus Saccharimonadales bacterium]